MALSALLLGAPKKMALWVEVGGSMIAIDAGHWLPSGKLAPAVREFEEDALSEVPSRTYRFPVARGVLEG